MDDDWAKDRAITTALAEANETRQDQKDREKLSLDEMKHSFIQLSACVTVLITHMQAFAHAINEFDQQMNERS